MSIFILLKAFLFRKRFQLKCYPQGKSSINFKINLSQTMLNILRLWFWFIYIYKSRIVFCMTYIITCINIYKKNIKIIQKMHIKITFIIFYLSFFSVIFILFCQLIRRFIRLDLSLGVYVRCFDLQYREAIDISQNDVIICFKRMLWKKSPKAFHIERLRVFF